MIDWIMDTTKGSEAVWESVNHTSINSTGFETDMKINLQRCRFKVSYSYIHQDKEQETGIVSQYALEYLRHKLVAHAMLPIIKRVSLDLNLRWQDRVGSYTDFNGEVCGYKPYTLADVRLTWQERRWKVYVESNNLFDTRYHDYGLVEQPGRWLIAGASVTL